MLVDCHGNVEVLKRVLQLPNAPIAISCLAVNRTTLPEISPSTIRSI